jgi:hypothetical protein
LIFSISNLPVEIIEYHLKEEEQACPNYENNDEGSPIITAPMLKPVLPGSFASLSIPLYRQEQQFKYFGIETLANWMIRDPLTS